MVTGGGVTLGCDRSGSGEVKLLEQTPGASVFSPAAPTSCFLEASASRQAASVLRVLSHSFRLLEHFFLLADSPLPAPPVSVVSHANRSGAIIDPRNHTTPQTSRQVSSVGQVDDGDPLTQTATVPAEPGHRAQRRVLPGVLPRGRLRVLRETSISCVGQHAATA